MKIDLNKYKLTKIVNITPNNTQQVYDIEVDSSDHAFNAKSESGSCGISHNSARMSTKFWKDASIFEFITVKRPIEYNGLNMNDILTYREESAYPPSGFLWSSNNSVMVDKEFWKLSSLKRSDDGYNDDIAKHARKVLKQVTESSYAEGTGEPGIINADKLKQDDSGWNDLNQGDYIGSSKYRLNEDTQILMSKLAKRAKRKKYHMITNPCGEISLNLLAGFCVLADVVPYHASSLEDADEAFRIATRSLIRVNKMDSIYKKEVDRTNRIGVGMTGIHEFAWKFFGYGFRDLIDEEKTKDFWLTLARFNKIVRDEAIEYSDKLGLVVPHTSTCIKPAGSTSKLFGLTEGYHLPSMAWYLRWVQFRTDDPLVEKYKKNNYPFKELSQYNGTTIIGFPTEPVIAGLGLGDKMVTAGEATPEEQYTWLKLGEKYWIRGVDPETGEEYPEHYGNQISYTLKYDPETVTFAHFRDMLKKHQIDIAACAVMPQTDVSVYEYQPEESISKIAYEELCRKISHVVPEDIGKEHIDCDNGGCPVDFNTGDK